MKIYLASSWRNARQPEVLAALRGAGHEVYDFRNPVPGDNGFSWKLCHDLPPAAWTVDEYLAVLEHPVAQRGFGYDMAALESCEACVLVLPCGRSAHMEWGWAVGAGRRAVVLCERLDEPELMYLMASRDPRAVVVPTIEALLSALNDAGPSAGSPAREEAAKIIRVASAHAEQAVTASGTACIRRRPTRIEPAPPAEPVTQ